MAEGAGDEALEKGLQRQEGSSQKHRMRLPVRKYRRIAERERSPPPGADAPFSDESMDGAGSSGAETVRRGEEQGQAESASPEVEVDFCDEPMDRRGEEQGQDESAFPEVEGDFCDEPMDENEQEETRDNDFLQETVVESDEVEEGGERGDDENDSDGNDNDNDGDDDDDDDSDSDDDDDDDDDGIFGDLFHPRIPAVHGMYDEAGGVGDEESSMGGEESGMDDEESSVDDEESNEGFMDTSLH